MRRALVCLFLAGCGARESATTRTFVPHDDSGGATGGQQPDADTISAVASTVSGTTASITWTTSAPADSEVDYGLASATGTGSFGISTKDAHAVTSHTITLTGLLSGTYQFDVRSTFADDQMIGDDNAGRGYVFTITGAPRISGVAANFDELTRLLTVTWTTDSASSSQVDIGLGNFATTTTLPALVTAHVVVISLCDGGDYFFRVTSTDANALTSTDAKGGPGYEANVSDPSLASGTSDDPFFICATDLPAIFSDNEDTTTSTQSLIDNYPPAAQAEDGPEFIYTFTLLVPATLNASIMNGAIPMGVDIDLQLLQAINPPVLFNESITSRADKTLSGIALPAGTYWLALDSFGLDGSKAGAYSLTVSLNSVSAASLTCTYATRPTPNGVPAEAAAVGCPAGMIAVSDFCIDKYEAMLVGIDGNGNAFSWSPFSNPGTQKVKALSVAGVVPQAYISRDEAAAACSEAGKHLCDSSEWLRACQGANGSTYPYGSTREPGVCNDTRAEHPAVEYYGSSASWVYTHLDNPCFDQEPSSEDAAGARTGCVTAEGAFDMMGNLHEWVADTQGNGNGVFRGGYYMDTTLNGNGCLYATTAHAPTYWDYSTGFRCCAAPK